MKKDSGIPGEMSLWTDGSRLDSECTGVTVAWCDHEWKTRNTYLRTNKEVLNAKLYAIGEAHEISLQSGGTGNSRR